MNWTVYRNYLVVVAGHSSKKLYKIYNLATESMYRQGEINEERYWHGVTKNESTIYAVLGQGGPNSIEEYDFSSDTWTLHGVTIMDSRISDTMAVFYLGNLYISVYGYNKLYVVCTQFWNTSTYTIDTHDDSVYRLMCISENKIYVISNSFSY
jgi:hypothetical protein